MAISDGHGLPLAVHVASASPHETKLVQATLENRFFADLPERLIGDRAYDSDRLDEQLVNHYGIEMIAPHSSIRTRTLTQDGRRLHRAPWPGSPTALNPKDTERICCFDLETLTLALLRCSKNKAFSLIMIRTKFRRLTSIESPERRIARQGGNSHETSEGATLAV